MLAADRQHLTYFPAWKEQKLLQVLQQYGITRRCVCVCGGLFWSHRAAAHFAGKEQGDDVMLFVRHHQMLCEGRGEPAQ